MPDARRILAGMTGAELREARKAAGMTQRQLADLVQVNQGTIAKWENDIYSIGGPERVALGLILGTGKAKAKASKRAKRVN